MKQVESSLKLEWISHFLPKLPTQTYKISTVKFKCKNQLKLLKQIRSLIIFRVKKNIYIVTSIIDNIIISTIIMYNRKRLRRKNGVLRTPVLYELSARFLHQELHDTKQIKEK